MTAPARALRSLRRLLLAVAAIDAALLAVTVIAQLVGRGGLSRHALLGDATQAALVTMFVLLAASLSAPRRLAFRVAVVAVALVAIGAAIATLVVRS